jgi:hypothetical protein
MPLIGRLTRLCENHPDSAMHLAMADMVLYELSAAPTERDHQAVGRVVKSSRTKKPVDAPESLN